MTRLNRPGPYGEAFVRVFVENSLFKADTLLGALHRFRNGGAAEAKLAENREQRRR
jgi:hypothetical protein